MEFGDYLTFLSRTLLVFGIAFEIPVFVILLNLAGVLRGAALGAHRPWIVIGKLVFAAVATPSGNRSRCCSWPARCWCCSGSPR